MEREGAMNSAFDPRKGKWELNWPERISRHDLLYLSPPADPMQELPIGNGDVGALCWCEESKIILALNKCDLWDDAKRGCIHDCSRGRDDSKLGNRAGCVSKE
jgi:hypothetical protein